MKNNKYMERNNNSEKNCCENPQIEIRDGNRVCINCGLVSDIQLVNEERRAYNREEQVERRSNEVRWREFGPRTIIPMDKVDSKGNVFKADQRTLFSRLSKIQKSLTSGLERNFWEAKPRLKLISSKLNIPEYIYENAWKIYTHAAKKRLTMGRTIDGFLTASLYVAIRVHDFPKLLEEVCDAALITRRATTQSLGLLIKEVLPDLNIKYKPITAEQLVFKFSNDLEIPLQTQKVAVEILKNSSKRGLNQMGKDPRGFAASAIYMATKNTKSKITQTKIAEVAKITEVTLRARVKDMKKIK